jgi:hypothetical protein
MIDWASLWRPSFLAATQCGERRTLSMPAAQQARFGVINLEDCIALCGLTEKEVLAIAEHEHVPEIAAASIGRYLLKEPKGAQKIRDMMRDDIHDALGRGDREHASELLMVLRHFISTHPEAKN